MTSRLCRGSCATRCLLLGLWVLSACGSDEPPAAASSRDPDSENGSTLPAANPNSDAAPRVGSLTGARVLAWQRIELEWVSAADDLTPPEAMRYRLHGAAAVAPTLGTSPSESGPAVFESEAGATSVVIEPPAGYHAWRLEAVDGGGHSAISAPPYLVRTVPPLEDVRAGGLAAPLVTCARAPRDGSLLCVGEEGRYATWHEREWVEYRLPHAAPVALANLDEQLEGYTVAGRFSFRDAGTIEPFADSFGGEPTYPLRRLAREPSGLTLWLDTAGALWGSDAGPFQRFDDPLLLGPERRCRRLRDIAVVEARVLAWCDEGEFYLLRPETHGYRWTALADADGLPDEVRMRRVLFGEGRQITVLTWSGTIWRYDLGGWRPLYEPLAGEANATALARAPEERLVWVGAGARVLALDALGQRQLVVELADATAIVHLEAGPSALAITARGAVASLPSGAWLRELPPAALDRTVRIEGVGVRRLATSEPPRLFRAGETGAGWAADPLPSWPLEKTVHGAVLTQAGSLLLAVDAGPEGGQIVEVTGARPAVVQPFVYPPTAPAPVTEPGAPPRPPAERLVGVAPERRRGESAPLEPPVRDVDVDTATGTAVAVGEGGRIWLRVSNGWLPLEVGLALPVPLLTVRVTGDHTFLVGGLDGAVLSCVWDACEAESAPVGDVRELRRTASGWLALGTEGVALRGPDGHWEVLFADPRPPYPSGEPPLNWISVDRSYDLGWWLGDDGSVWHETDRELTAMGLVDGPLYIETSADGAALITARTGVFRLAAP